ncbi:MAG: GDSL-type esterase/lipase family protein [Solirubrobacteraceae bacterium]|nr:GDSL-type esterase/lipase family protein [Solirubrobacteraceae bacterium]
MYAVDTARRGRRSAAATVAAIAGVAMAAGPASPAGAASQQVRPSQAAPRVSVDGRTATVRWSRVTGVRRVDVQVRRSGTKRFRTRARRAAARSARVRRLEPGRRYAVRLRYRLRDGATRRTRSRVVRVPGVDGRRPKVSAGLRFVGPVRTTVAGGVATVGWDAVAGADAYAVDRVDRTTGTTVRIAGAVTGTSTTDPLPADAPGHWIAYVVTPLADGAPGTPAAGPSVRPAGVVRYAHHVALGDSYASGAGVGGAQGSATCGQARGAWSRKLPTTLAPAPVLLACNGAMIPHMLRTGQGGAGQLGGETQIDGLVRELAARTGPTLVTVVAGGNDADLIGILGRCLDGDCLGARSGAEARIRGPLRQAYDRLFAQLRDAAPGADILALGYPQVIDHQTGGWNPFAGFSFSAAERTMIQGLITLVNQQMAQSAAAHGVAAKADATERRFSGHVIGSSDPYLSSPPALQGPAELIREFLGASAPKAGAPSAPVHPNDAGTSAQARAAADTLGAWAGRLQQR